MRKRFYGLAHWLLELFDPPPLASMTQTQKAGRVILLSTTLVIGSVVVAMLGAVGLFLVQKSMEFRDTPEFIAGIGIVALGILVNSACLMALIFIKRADHKLIPPQAGSANGKRETEGK